MATYDRFQGDSEWQADFGRLAEALARCKEHTVAGHHLRDAGALDEARAELALADEEHELADLMADMLSLIGV